jgi:hypothetical protein
MKKYFALIIATALSLTSQAKEVDSLSARTVATAFFSSKGIKSVVNDITPKNFKGNLYLFVGEKGFVLLPADDAVRQVLAYSSESSFPSGNLPPQVKALLQDYSDVVEYARQNNLPQHPSWKTILSGTESHSKEGGVAPMVTARWGQSYPYNTLCPLDSNWIDPYPQCVTGCVATAMAQIMHYWQWPVRGWGQHEYDCYTETMRPIGRLSDNFDTVYYQWGHMPDVLDTLSSDAEIYAVSRLMYDCGVAVNMHYSAKSSGAHEWSNSDASLPSAGQALRTYFRYHPQLQGVDRTNYSDGDWMGMMLAELDAGRPLLYVATDVNDLGPHAFLVDGYDGNHYLHFNFGWNGRYDGFYAVNSICLTDNIAFLAWHRAVIGIHPNTEESDTVSIQAIAADTIAGYCTGGGQYTYADSVSLTAHAEEGYRFAGWSSGVYENPHYLPATASLSDTARFCRLGMDTLYHCNSIVNPIWDYWSTATITQWGIRFSASSLHGERKIDAVQFYTKYPMVEDTVSLNIYSGDLPNGCAPLYQHVYNIPSGPKGWFNLVIDSTVVIDTTADLWIVFEKESGWGFNWNQFCRSIYSGNSDGCWFYNQNGWHTLDSVGVWTTWMMRALTSPYTGPTDISELSILNSQLSIYPNPTQGKVTIECNETLAETAWLIDLTGHGEQVHLTADGTGRYTLDLTACPQAIYLLSAITASGDNYTVRLVKQSNTFSK